MPMKRNIRTGVDDLWSKTVRDADGSIRTVASARHGRGMRWRARYVDGSGHERTKVFGRKADAQIWLDTEITPKLANGTCVTPQAGRVRVASVYESWSASQGHISPKVAATRCSTWGSRVQPQWGDVAVVDMKTSAIRARVAKLIADDVGVPSSRTRSDCCARCSAPRWRIGVSLVTRVRV